MPSKTASAARSPAPTWVWRRWIPAGRQDAWIEKVEASGCASWSFTERPLRPRALLEAYFDSRSAATALVRRSGGTARSINPRQWSKTRRIPPTRIGERLEIAHEKPRVKAKPLIPRLHIPHGLAFGSGEHATTSMLLGALTRYHAMDQASVLDLGTGSGVLALAARLFGASKIVATDFDEEAVRTARQNEALNFPQPLIRWTCSDVKKLRAKVRYELVLANLFSGILCEAAPQISASVAPGGQLWLSGILAFQRDEVIAAYRRQGLPLMRALRRGKWVMLMLGPAKAARN